MNKYIVLGSNYDESASLHLLADTPEKAVLIFCMHYADKIHKHWNLTVLVEGSPGFKVAPFVEGKGSYDGGFSPEFYS